MEGGGNKRGEVGKSLKVNSGGCNKRGLPKCPSNVMGQEHLAWLERHDYICGNILLRNVVSNISCCIYRIYRIWYIEFKSSGLPKVFIDCFALQFFFRNGLIGPIVYFLLVKEGVHFANTFLNFLIYCGSMSYVIFQSRKCVGTLVEKHVEVRG